MCTSGRKPSDDSCEWSTGEFIPLIKPKSCSNKIKARHLTTAAKKYLSINDLWKLLDKGHRVIAVRDINDPKTKEEELLSLTHRVIVVEKSEGVVAECIAPVDETGMFVRHTTGIDRTSSSTFYRSVADYNGLVLLAFSYELGGPETKVHFDAMYLDFYSLQIIKHKECITNLTTSKFKFHLMLNCGVFCLLWPFHGCFSVLDFTKTHPLHFIQYPIDEDLDEFYVAELSGQYLSLTMNNKSFHDDVFFVSYGSKRDTVYYSMESGSKYSSQVAMQKMSKLMKIENPVDVVFLGVPNKPMWMVTECLPDDMTLSSITFFSEVELDKDATVCVKKRLDLSHLVSENKSLFELPNEHQINFEICKIHWHVFLWISKRHILQIDLTRLQPSAILEVETNDYNDFKNDLYDFTMKMSLDRKDINVFIRDRKSIVHFECFHSPLPIELKQLAKYKLTTYHPKLEIEKLSLKSDLKKEILAAY